MGEKYRSTEDLRHFGSDLNKYAHENCIKEMTVINIDFLSYKASKHKIRIIESKHTNESMGRQQRVVLELFASLFKKLNEKLTYECYIIKGDYPYITSEIEDLVNKSIFAVDQENLIKFLNFEDYTII